MKTEVNNPKYMRPAGLCAHLNISRSTLYNWMANLKGFPKPVRPGIRVTLFCVQEIEDFIRAKA